MNRILYMLSIIATILTSCSDSSKPIKSEMIVNKMEKTDGSLYLTYQSKSKKTTELIADLETILEKLNTKEIVNSKRLLFYIDATNGNIFISGFDSQSGEVYDDKGIWIELQNLWNDNENSMDFDEIVIESIEGVFETKIGEQTKEQFEIFYQTEVDEAEKIK